jgi:hypothetical protein
MMGSFFVANYPAVILFDSGASHTFMSKTFVEKHCILLNQRRVLLFNHLGVKSLLRK